MQTLIQLFGKGEHLDTLQMTLRGAVAFIYSLVLIRLSGRRSFGLRNPMDNIIAILLGAILSRGVVGASPLLPVSASCLVVVLLHRSFGWLIVRYPWFSHLVEGNKIVLYKDGKLERKNLSRALLSEEDVMEGIRESAMTDDLSQIDKVYLERNGGISAIKKSGTK